MSDALLTKQGERRASGITYKQKALVAIAVENKSSTSRPFVTDYPQHLNPGELVPGVLSIDEKKAGSFYFI